MNDSTRVIATNELISELDSWKTSSLAEKSGLSISLVVKIKKGDSVKFFSVKTILEALNLECSDKYYMVFVDDKHKKTKISVEAEKKLFNISISEDITNTVAIVKNIIPNVSNEICLFGIHFNQSLPPVIELIGEGLETKKIKKVRLLIALPEREVMRKIAIEIKNNPKTLFFDSNAHINRIKTEIENRNIPLRGEGSLEIKFFKYNPFCRIYLFDPYEESGHCLVTPYCYDYRAMLMPTFHLSVNNYGMPQHLINAFENRWSDKSNISYEEYIRDYHDIE